MLAELRVLAGLAERDDPGFVRGFVARVVVAVVAEWLVLFTVMQGLARQRAGQVPDAEFVLFVAAVVAYFWGQRIAFVYTGHRFVAVTRGAIEGIALRLHRMPLIAYEALGRGMLMTRLIGDGNRLATSGRLVVNALTASVRLAVAGVFILFEAAGAAIAAVVVALLVVAIGVGQLRLMKTGFRGIASAEAELFDRLRDQLRGALPLRLHGPRARAIGAVYSELSARLRALRVDIWSRFLARQYASSGLVYMLIGLNVFVLPLVVTITDEAVRDINLAILWLLFSVVQLVFLLPPLGDAAAAAERLRALDAQLADADLDPVPPPVGRGRFDGFTELVVDGLRFGYPARAGRPGFAVGPVSLRLRRGELVYVVGHNGSGKSTFLKMLTGLYAAEAGALRVDGEAIAPADLADYRALFGTIFVDHTLFERTYGLAGAEDRIAGLLRELDIADKTAVVDGRVTRRDLSTGQKKRLAMALTRCRDRPIMVFDEWAADQDPGFRDYYYQHLLPALRDAGKLVIIVSHDDQHFGLADRVVQFADGRVVVREERPA